MYLSYLVYQSAKAAADYGDHSFNYENFLTGQSAQDEDYSAFIEKALPVVNEFIQRAYELNKLPAKVVKLDKNALGEYELPPDFGKCISLFQLRNGQAIPDPFTPDSDVHWLIPPTSDYQVVAFRKNGKNIVPLTPYWAADFYLQYRPKVKFFTESDMPHEVSVSYEGGETVYEYYEYSSTKLVPNGEKPKSLVELADIDLEEEYGFSDSLATICIAYVQGRLMDDRSEGHSREIEAERRLQDITLDETLYLQKRIVRKFR